MKELCTNLLSKSPDSVSSPLLMGRPIKAEGTKLSLNEFIHSIPAVIQKEQQTKLKIDTTDSVAAHFHKLDFTQADVSRYSHTNTMKNYTRNLIATDNQTFTLLLLCWNPQKCSPIHDHPCNGCWMRVLQGSINEKRYIRDDENNLLVCSSDSTFCQGDETFINDTLGYHKIGNNGEELAISLHLYSPPFGKCRVWKDENNGCESSISCMSNYYSAYGNLIETEK
jgi:predicted metal-dependent enzyme (double-stranded beta helix superfamily)